MKFLKAIGDFFFAPNFKEGSILIKYNDWKAEEWQRVPKYKILKVGHSNYLIKLLDSPLDETVTMEISIADSLFLEVK